MSTLIGICLGILSVGLACLAIVLSKKADRKYTEILRRVDKNIAFVRDNLKRLDREKDMIKDTTGNVIVKPLPAELRLKTYPPEVKVEKKSKEAAQKRLDEDTQKVGYVRGEIYQLEDGSWGIAWGGKYPL